MGQTGVGPFLRSSLRMKSFGTAVQILLESLNATQVEQVSPSVW